MQERFIGADTQTNLVLHFRGDEAGEYECTYETLYDPNYPDLIHIEIPSIDEGSESVRARVGGVFTEGSGSKGTFELPDTWQNITSRKCQRIWDLISKLYKLGVELTDNKTPDDVRKIRTAGELLTYAVRLWKDNQLWNSLPDTLTFDPHTRKELILDRMYWLGRFAHLGGLEGGVAQTREFGDEELTTVFDQMQQNLPTEEERQAEVFREYKKKLFEVHRKEELRDQLYALLNECM